MDLLGWGHAILRSETTLQVQVAEALVLAVLVKAVMMLTTKVVKIVSAGKPYIPRVIELTQRQMKTMLQVDIDEELALHFWEITWGIGVQHMLGGALCVPLITGRFCSYETALVLARHGALCEVGWEIGDIVERAWQVLFGGEYGKKMNPLPLLALLACHHAMSMCLVIPMNVNFHDLIPYFELVFLLEGAAAVALIAQQYSYTLNVDSLFDLRQMFWMTLANFSNMVFCRMIYYWYVVYKILVAFWAANSMGFFYAGFVVAILLMPVIGFLFCADGVKKLMKFGKLYFSKSVEEGDPTSPVKTSAERRQMLRHLTIDINTTTTGPGTPHARHISLVAGPNKHWAEVRSAVKLMGLLKSHKEQ